MNEVIEILATGHWMRDWMMTNLPPERTSFGPDTLKRLKHQATSRHDAAPVATKLCVEVILATSVTEIGLGRTKSVSPVGVTGAVASFFGLTTAGGKPEWRSESTARTSAAWEFPILYKSVRPRGPASCDP